MAWVAWKLSGMDRDKVIGTGLDLATASYRNIISSELKLSGKSCLGFLQGTLGDEMCESMYDSIEKFDVKNSFEKKNHDTF